MDYTTLGNTGMKVSVAGLGCGGFSQLGLAQGKSEADAVAIIRQAVELGIEIGKYRGVVRVPRRVFQRLLPERPTPRAVRRGLLSPTAPVREHRRAKVAPAPVDRRWECRDQRAGLALTRRWETVPPARGASQIDPNRSFTLV